MVDEAPAIALRNDPKKTLAELGWRRRCARCAGMARKNGVWPYSCPHDPAGNREFAEQMRIERWGTKHDQRRCTTCREYARHQTTHKPIGDWTKKLGPIHFVPRLRQRSLFACGRRYRPGKIWTLDPKLATCRTCKRIALTYRNRFLPGRKLYVKRPRR